MAKRSSSGKKPTRKRSSSKRKTSKKSQGSNWGLLVGLLGFIVILLIIASYYYEKDPVQITRQEKQNQSSPSQDITREESKPSQRESSSRQEEEVRVETRETNPRVPEIKEVDEYYFTNSFDFSWPTYEVGDLIVEHEGFALSYDEKNEQASWVAYKLEKKNLDNARFKRKDNFREDPLVRTGSATPADYRKSGYDRGHLAPAADFTWSEKALDHTFYMSNMSPQDPGFNRGIWKKLEEQVRDWARENNVVYVVTGPIIEKRKERIGANKVTVPQYYYKAILDIQEPELKAIGFVMENKKSGEDIMESAVTIDRIEAMTGLDLFPSLPDEMETRLEKSVNESLWK